MILSTPALSRLRTLIRPGLVLFCLVLLQGCAVKLAYRQLDWLIPWYVEDYLALDNRQEKQFRHMLDDWLEWHRRTQLPAYAAFLRQVARQAGDGLDEAELVSIQARTEELTRQLISAMGPPLATLLADATDAQVAHLTQKFAEDNRRYREEKIALADREARENAVDELIEGLERWVGGLDDHQRVLVEEWGQRYRPMAPEWLAARQRWQQAFAQVLAKRRSEPDAYRQGLLSLMDNPRLGRSPAFEEAIAHNHRQLAALQHRLDDSLSPAQRDHLIGRLRDYARAFEELSAD